MKNFVQYIDDKYKLKVAPLLLVGSDYKVMGIDTYFLPVSVFVGGKKCNGVDIVGGENLFCLSIVNDLDSVDLNMIPLNHFFAPFKEVVFSLPVGLVTQVDVVYKNVAFFRFKRFDPNMDLTDISELLIFEVRLKSPLATQFYTVFSTEYDYLTDKFYSCNWQTQPTAYGTGGLSFYDIGIQMSTTTQYAIKVFYNPRQKKYCIFASMGAFVDMATAYKFQLADYYFLANGYSYFNGGGFPMTNVMNGQ